ncbi:restriction endonuclease subunit S [Chromohalobacter canadensis]|uniref:restriction endonuclease subunit S n=1 Tax=Chromohalobacter canadensis TaxID=141389 RepID=UPI0021BF9E35|nr:restriction endonuclease subunit S [Chromohalobacter canadensis]MCT8467536.1 restriction endonuclease subunit S [Chromohalobacter canadensis]MCT8470716.1 restriction endonuclease subunit S [Chromohalobacter canadensis]MCT8498033.1 restriction endonuclease subunit S [Chromohalobacter canadensis]
MSTRELITEHLDLWTSAVTHQSGAGRGSNGKVELTGIKKLRELILELAVCGKLVEQDSNDEPANVLLEKIAEEKARLVQEGKIKKPQKLPEINQEEVTAELPITWSWARLGEFTNYGVTEKAEPGEVEDTSWVLELEDIEKESSRLLQRILYKDRPFKSSKNRFIPGDVLYGKLRPYLDKVFVADRPGACTTEIIPIRGFHGICPFYLRIALKSSAFKSYADDATHGMNLPRLGTDRARMAVLPLPPKEEQSRIAEKVDELMALCDRLEQQVGDQLEAHELLVCTLLDALTSSEDSGELGENWAHVAEHFDSLFTTEASIDKLKQTILQLAVMGRLVPQAPKEEPGSVLQDRINEERNRLKKFEGMRTKASDHISPEEMYLGTPDDWAWVRLGNTAKFIDYRGKTPKKTDKGKRLITAKNIRKGVIDKHPEEFISEEDYQDWMTRGFPRKGDTLFTTEAPLGNAANVALQEDFALAQRAICFQWHIEEISPFMLIQIMANPFQEKLVENSTGMTARGIKSAKLKEIPVTLPPLSEQHRIVKKVGDLMELCDFLKFRIAGLERCVGNMAETMVEQVK